MQLYGPFTQLLTLADLPKSGSIRDELLAPIKLGGILVDGKLNSGGIIKAVGIFEQLRKAHPQADVVEVAAGHVAMPGLIDCHTHLCWAGSRAQDYALRNAGATYLEMAESGGGIKYTVAQTRAASDAQLRDNIDERLAKLSARGITTAECKSGYGLTVHEELRHLKLIGEAAKSWSHISLVATCLAAHVCPPEFAGNPEAYLQVLTEQLLPALKKSGNPLPRIDAFAEPSTFWGPSLERYLSAAKAAGFQLTLHADQFTEGGAALACNLGALSADHLENSGAESIQALAASAKTSHPTVAVALPGASLGLGEPYTPARKLLDAGAIVAIASDWNPGSAPQGQLLAQASILASAQKLSNAEVWAGLTTRAAQALGLQDRGTLQAGARADISVWPCTDYREITWQMGSLQPISIHNL